MNTGASVEAVDSVEVRLKKLVIDHLGLPEDEKITSETRVVQDLGCDSLEWLEIVMAAEEMFEVTIDDCEADKAGNFGELAKLIERLRG